MLANDFVKPEDQKELARFGLARNRTFKNGFVWQLVTFFVLLPRRAGWLH